MRDLCRFTARTLNTKQPSPFGALIVSTRNGKPLMRATNAVMREHDPSSHAELRTVRRACKRLKRTSLAGFTMYSTCEPCPMCMANALWARLDRVIYGATIADANRYCLPEPLHSSQHPEGFPGVEHREENEDIAGQEALVRFPKSIMFGRP